MIRKTFPIKLIGALALILAGMALLPEPSQALPCCEFNDDMCCKWTNFSCNGYTCKRKDKVNPSSQCSDCGDGTMLICSAPGTVQCAYFSVNTPAQNGSRLAENKDPISTRILDLIITPAYAADPTYWGYRNDVNKSGAAGSTKPCEAQLHVCFTSGNLDSALSGVDTTNECNNACDTMQSPSQIACSYSDCQDRCYCGRANTSCGCI